MDDKEHVVYILRCKDNSLYTGYTNNLENRLKAHRDGKGAKYTRGRGPFQVVYIEKIETKEQALKREYEIKQLKRKEKLLLIQNWLKEVVQNENSKEL
ncbi:GIY-YIG nuclease family protein [Oceanobacillus caeni]|uniref:Endonuclease n=1 Tax=Oceanobacillus caeni TaxID=405946 RepID=A0ABR5MG85_9BACI|nr:GIY-YIG nuclease family protein [Oceanobacillus caeni]KPH71535.1 endonuclease [Oceanobacillus caeni]MBU8790911.1 GIY-YIG nuclease family protein [Oceanobacillus caeni]MED4473367.1 GIY-YIG nuclease family protein [Oceanobacillus caeni]